MTPRALAIAAAAVLTALPATAADEDLAARKQEAAAIVGAFFGELKGELEAGMASGGPPAAITVCNEKAPKIAAAHAARTGWTVGRTSTRLRNPKNAPDAWEQAVLADFETRKAAGEKPDTLTAAAIVESGGTRTFRFMKAIPTANLCLNCHGTEIAPETQARLEALYPGDKARGYRVNELRGAFTLSKRL